MSNLVPGQVFELGSRSRLQGRLNCKRTLCVGYTQAESQFRRGDGYSPRDVDSQTTIKPFASGIMGVVSMGAPGIFSLFFSPLPGSAADAKGVKNISAFTRRTRRTRRLDASPQRPAGPSLQRFLHRHHSRVQVRPARSGAGDVDGTVTVLHEGRRWKVQLGLPQTAHNGPPL